MDGDVGVSNLPPDKWREREGGKLKKSSKSKEFLSISMGQLVDLVGTRKYLIDTELFLSILKSREI